MALALSLEEKADLDAAIEEGNLERVEAFLRKGLDPNANPEGTLDLLWWSALRAPTRNSKVVELFLEYGANARYSRSDGFNALHAFIDINAASNSDEEDQIVQLLVGRGAQLEEVYQFYGWTSLMHSVMRGSLSEVHALLKAGADANKRFPQNALPHYVAGLTLIMAAASRPSLLKLLLQYNGDPTVRNNEGENAATYFERLILEAEQEFSEQDLRAKAEDEVKMMEQAYLQIDNELAQKHGSEVALQLRKLRQIDADKNTVAAREKEILEAHILYVQDLKDCIKILRDT